jgi:hypothetical protein
MADGSHSIEPKKSARRASTIRLADGGVPEKPDIYPAGTQIRLCTVGLALEGATVLFNDVMNGSTKACAVMATLDLAIAELTRINRELEESRGC